MPDDLSAPLGLRPAKRPLWQRLPFGWAGGAILGLVAVVLGLWLTFVRNPQGGEPAAVVKIDRSKTGIARSDVGVSDATRPAVADGTDVGTPSDRPAAGLTEAKPQSDNALEPVPPRRVWLVPPQAPAPRAGPGPR